MNTGKELRDVALDNIIHTGAIVSRLVALGSRAIMIAERSESVDSADSGWQFLASGELELDPSQAQIWAVSEVLDVEPSLAPYLEMPVGTKLTRTSTSRDWSAR
jgi:hypothetical protein